MTEEKKALRAFGKRLCILALIVLAADQVTGWGLRQLYYRQQSGEVYRATWAMDSTRAPLLILGSSRASHHYNPLLLDTILQFSVYNAGRDGNDILGNWAFFRAALRRYTPRIIILELMPREMYSNRLSYDRLSALLPYYRSHPEIQEIIRLRGPFEHWKLRLACYPFNSQLVRLVNGRWKLNSDPANRYHGYLPLKGSTVTGRYNNQLPDPETEVDANKMRALREIAATCKQKNISLLLVNSPVYSNSAGGRAADSIAAVCRDFGIPWCDFSDDARFDGFPELFRDNSHLNEAGANRFTRLLADSILHAGWRR